MSETLYFDKFKESQGAFAERAKAAAAPGGVLLVTAVIAALAIQKKPQLAFVLAMVGAFSGGFVDNQLLRTAIHAASAGALGAGVAKLAAGGDAARMKDASFKDILNSTLEGFKAQWPLNLMSKKDEAPQEQKTTISQDTGLSGVNPHEVNFENTIDSLVLMAQG